MEKFKLTKTERKNNLKVFINEIIPELNKKGYKTRIINEICNHYRIQYKDKTIDFYPKSGKLCYMDYKEWVTIELNEYLLRITTYLDLQ